MPEPPTPLAGPTDAPRFQGVVVVAARQHRRYWLHIGLLLLTFATTVVVGAHLQYNFDHDLPAFSTESYHLSPAASRLLFHSREPIVFELPFPLHWIEKNPAQIWLGIPFATTLMGILLAHEMGHFVYCVRYGVNATLPFFLPGPLISPIGTFGAVIRIRSPIRSRKSLFDIGIAGPIAGFIVAVPVLLCGLALSKPMPAKASGSLISFGYPLIFHLMHGVIRAVQPQAPPLGATYLHPVAVAAWVGMLATALNLLPGGQLDGGHLVYAMAPRMHRWVTMTTVVVLAVLSIFWIGWLLWAIVLGITGWRHPPVAPWPELSKGRRRMALVAVVMLALTWVPAPILDQGWLTLK